MSQDKILEILKESGKLNSEQLMKLTNVNESTFYQNMRRLERGNLVGSVLLRTKRIQNGRKITFEQKVWYVR